MASGTANLASDTLLLIVTYFSSILRTIGSDRVVSVVHAAQLYSVEQVADLLGLHVKTVRHYVRDGRLRAVRIGKQYRIARADLEAFTGHPAPGPAPARETVPRRRQVEVSTVVQIDAIGRDAASRIAGTLLAATRDGSPDGERLRLDTIYDEEKDTMKIVVLGSPGTCAALLRLVDTLLESP